MGEYVQTCSWEQIFVCQGQAVASAQTQPEPAQQTKLNTLHYHQRN